MWPSQLEKILCHYYNIQERNSNKNLTLGQKKELVKELVNTYNTLSNIEKIDILVPAKWQFVEDHAIKADIVGSGKYRYEINYKWPPNNGFEGPVDKITLMPGSEYDRIGGNKGTFLAPVLTKGGVESFLARAIPYYVPEANISDNPAYHRYRVIKQYQGSSLGTKDFVLQGVIAHAFWCSPDDGGGIQVKLPKRIVELGGVLSEI